MIKDSYQFLTIAYEKNGDPKNALYYHKQFTQIQTKLLNKKLEDKLGNVTILNDLNIKEQEVKQLNVENKLNKTHLKKSWNYIYTLLFLLVIIISFSCVIYYFV